VRENLTRNPGEQTSGWLIAKTRLDSRGDAAWAPCGGLNSSADAVSTSGPFGLFYIDTQSLDPVLIIKCPVICSSSNWYHS
jgi:hypothetical protein